MANDRLGKVIAVGDTMVLAGVVARIDSTEIEIQSAKGQAFRCDAGDLVGVDFAAPDTFPIGGGPVHITEAGTVTAANVYWDPGKALDTQNYKWTVPEKCELMRVGFAAYHFNGSDPGDWTLDVHVNGSGTPSASITWQWSASDFPVGIHETNDLGTPLALAKGDFVHFNASGPSITLIIVNVFPSCRRIP